MDGYRITITEEKMGTGHSDRILHINSTALSELVGYGWQAIEDDMA